MTYRKIWFDYVLWVVYAGLCIMLLAYTGNRLYASCVGTSLAGLGAFVLFPVLICLYTGIRLISQAIRKKHCFSAHFAALAESLMVSVSFVFGTIIRIREGLLMASIYDSGSAFEPGDYYELAVVRAGGWGMSFAHGMGDLYVRCLRIILSFLGNSVAAAMFFQVILQVASMIFAYLAVRKAAGWLASCTMLLLLAFSSSFIHKIDVIDPECLLIALFLAGLYLVISFVRASVAGREIFGGWPGMFLLGAFLGLLSYLEGGCAVLFLFLTGLFTGKPVAGAGRKRRIGNLLIVLAGGGAGFFGSIAEDAATSGVVFYQGLTWWLDTYLDLFAGAKMFGVIGTDYPFFVVLFLLASFVVFAFIMGGHEQDFSLWLLPCILVTPVFLIDFTVVGFGGVALFFWSTMAGLGLKGAVFGRQAVLMGEKDGKINVSTVPEPAVAVFEAPGPEAGDPAALSPASAASTAGLQKKPRFIENPLPLPKKHVKREMDFDYKVLEADMHYDVEVDEEDDFDRF